MVNFSQWSKAKLFHRQCVPPTSRGTNGDGGRKVQSMFRLLTLCLALLFAFPAHAQTFPQLTGRVVDNANLLSPAQKADLTTKLAALEAKNARQVVIVTLPDLQGYPIEDYG